MACSGGMLVLSADDFRTQHEVVHPDCAVCHSAGDGAGSVGLAFASDGVRAYKRLRLHGSALVFYASAARYF